MRKFMLVFALAWPLVCLGQSTIVVPPQQCVWRAGENPAWAAPHLDESGWQPNPNWQRFPPAARVWMRCHANLSALKSETQPAIQITLYGAYQLFVNGELIGGAGNIRSGVFSLNVIRQYPLRPVLLDSAPETIALRITYRVFGQLPVTSALSMDPPIIYAGDLEALEAQRAKVILEDGSALLPSTAMEAMIGVLGLTLLGLFFYHRDRLDLLYLSILCVAVGALRVNSFCMAMQMDYSSSLRFAINQVGNALAASVILVFFFALARRRVPVLYWVPLTAILAQYMLSAATVFLPPAQSISVFAWTREAVQFLVLMICWLVVSTAPFIAFWPYSRITRRLRPLAALCLVFGAANMVWFVVEITSIPQLGLPNLYRAWGLQLIDIRGVLTACVLIALLILLFRDYRNVAEERALLAGEMEAAREIQQYLIPEKLPPTPGLAIESVYHPSREVGGDFFQVLPDARDGSTLIVVGDVAGKGLKAGMLAALIVGAVRTAFKFTSEPGEILGLLNERLQGRGLVTCMALRIDCGGSGELANAGQLPPYINGKELAVEGTLPLGAAPGVAFSTMQFELAPGEAMLLVSDGVIEARNSSGELFGFDRTREISRESAEKIAAAAQDFGQQDDITVLTLTFAPAEVLHAQ